MGRMTTGAMRLIGMFGAAAALSAAGPAAAAENLLRNPGFESIFSSAWSTSSMGVTPGNAHGGFYTMNAGCTGTTALTANSCSTSQVATTVAGTAYDISFWVRNLSAANNTTGYRATFGTTDTGTIRYTVVDAWTQYAFTAIASGTSTTFRFYGRNSQGVMAFDDFSISPVVAAIPEPATWAMMLVGFGMVGAAARYRRVPTGVAAFPDPVFPPPPRSQAAKTYPIARWTEMQAGGHFAALEQPGLLLADMRRFFADQASPKRDRRAWAIGAAGIAAIGLWVLTRNKQHPHDPAARARATYPPLDVPKPFAEDIWIVDSGPINAMGLKLPLRMTIIRLGNGDLMLHSPTPFSPEVTKAVEALGRIRHLVAPNIAHWTFLADWQRAYPDATTWAAPGLRDRAQVRASSVRFDAELGGVAPPDWADTLDQGIVSGGAEFSEVWFLHRPTRTLVLVDLIENLDPDKLPPISRVLMQASAATDGTTARYLRLPVRLGGADACQSASKKAPLSACKRDPLRRAA